MAALHRPVGDEIAEVYGPYKSRKDLRKLKIGDKLDMLCTDGLNYHVEIKELEDDRTARIHFMYWGKKYDYVGLIDTLYLADMGKYSEGISAQNTYPALAKTADEEEKPTKKSSSSHASSSNNKAEVQKPSYTEAQRYPEDFLSKPRFKTSQTRKRSNEDEQVEDIGGPLRKRKSGAAAALDNVSPGGDDDGDDDDDDSPVVKAESDPTTVPDDSNGNDNDSSDDASGNGDEVSNESQPQLPPAPTVHHRLLVPGHADASSSSAVIPPKVVTSASSDAAYRVALDAVTCTEEMPGRHQAILSGLRGLIGSDTSAKETKKALLLIAKYPKLFENGGDGHAAATANTNGTLKKPQYTATMLSELLLARQQIDEVVSEILISLA
jgi:hypothetical protein